MRRTLALLTLLLAMPAAAQGNHFLKAFTRGPLPQGLTFGGDTKWTLSDRFVPMDHARYFLVGYPGFKFGANRTVPEQVAFPILDAQTRQLSFATLAPTAPYVSGSDLVSYDPGRKQGGFFVQERPTGRQTFTHWDLTSGSLDWSAELGKKDDRHWFRAIGVEPGGRYFYFCEESHRSKALSDSVHADQVTFGRVDLTTQAVDDWRYAVPLPARTGSLVGSLEVYPSADYRLIVVTEHSEPGSGKVTPPPMAFVVETGPRRHFSLPIPPTPYGVAIDRQNRYLAIGSNVQAKVYRYDLQKRQQDLVVASVPRLHGLAISADNSRLYAMGKGAQLDLMSWPACKLVKRLPANALAPGEAFVDPEGMGVSPDGHFAVLAHTKAPWGFKDDQGFYLTEL